MSHFPHTYIVNPVLATNTPITNNETLSEKFELELFNSWKGVISQVTCIIKDDTDYDFEIALFNSDFTETTAGQPINMSDSDGEKFVTKIEFASSDFKDYGSFRVASIVDLQREFTINKENEYKLFGQLISRSSAGITTITANGMTLKFIISERD